MALEVYSATQAASPVRTWLGTIALLLVSGGLAASLSIRARGELLDERVEPEGWEISFQPPGPLKSVDPPPDEFATTFRYVGASDKGGLVELTIRRITVDSGVSASDVAERVLFGQASWLRRLLGAPIPRIAAMLGPLEAVEIHDPQGPAVIRAAVTRRRLAYVVAFRSQSPSVNESDYRLFDAVCRSIQFVHPTLNGGGKP